MKIDELLNRYFEGETSCEEERELRRYFTEGDVREDLAVYRPLFACIDEEAKAYRTTQTKTMAVTDADTVAVTDAVTDADAVAVTDTTPGSNGRRRTVRLYRLWSGIAAGVLLLIGIANLGQRLWMTPTDYVIIDGKRYTDARVIRQQALSAFQDVQMSREEVLDLMFE